MPASARVTLLENGSASDPFIGRPSGSIPASHCAAMSSPNVAMVNSWCFSGPMRAQMPEHSDPVEQLLADFDGSELAALSLRRAILNATAALPVDHTARVLLGALVSNIDVAVISNQLGGWHDLRAEMMRQWQAIRDAIDRALN